MVKSSGKTYIKGSSSIAYERANKPSCQRHNRRC